MNAACATKDENGYFKHSLPDFLPRILYFDGAQYRRQAQYKFHEFCAGQQHVAQLEIASQVATLRSR
jgi:hypothetical protein